MKIFTKATDGFSEAYKMKFVRSKKCFRQLLTLMVLITPLLFHSFVHAQQAKTTNGIEITSVDVLNNGSLTVNIQIDKTEKNNQVGAQNFVITERNQGELDTLLITKINTGIENLRFLFYTDNNIDISASEPIITAIGKSLESNNIPKASYTNAGKTDGRTFKSFEELAGLLKHDVLGDYQYVVVIFSDDKGIFSFNSEVQEGKLELLEAIKKNIDNLSIYPFLIGADKAKIDLSFAKQIADKTKDKKDGYKFYKEVNTIRFENDLADIHKKYFDNYNLIIDPGNKRFRGENRTLSVYWSNDEGMIYDRFNYKIGTPLEDAIEEKFSITSWLTWWFIGAILVLAILALFSFLIPEIRRMNFKKNFVRVYGDIKEAGVQKRDPVTGEVFEDDDLVVIKCQHMTAYSSWQFHKNQCAYYPDECEDGVINVDSSRFFSQEGVNRRLNWLWFGILGGFLSWTLSSLLVLLPESITGVFSNFLLSTLGLSSDLGRYITTEWVLGLSLGLCLTFYLSLVEERGQSSKFNWLWVILRSLIAGILAMVVFIGGFYFAQKMNIDSLYLQYLPSWLCLGLILGLVLSIKSTIFFTRGVLGGLIASLVAFTFYHFFSSFFPSDELAKMFSFILFGAIMGLVLVAVINRVGDFYLEYIEPEKFRRVNPIGKWLKTGIDVQIGSDPSSYVFVKWNDQAVEGKHAVLTFDGKRVFIEAFAPTFLNNRSINVGVKYPLKNNDIIKPGANSVTKFMFKENTDAAAQEEYIPVAPIANPQERIVIKRR